MIDVSVKRMARIFRWMAEKPNYSNPLRAPDGLAFPLPSYSASSEAPHTLPLSTEITQPELLR